MFYQDTVAAIATSSKDGSISVIRVSGSQSLEMVSKIFAKKNGSRVSLNECETHTVQYGFIQNEKNEILDEVLLLIMKGPRSYTAENLVEIQCHGGYMICQLILELLIKNGVRLAEPGEFTKRAFLNGRIDLSQAESVMDVIQSKSKIALDNSLNQLRGSVKKKIVDLRETILEDVAYLEAALDDPEHISLDNFPETMKEHALILQKEVNHLFENSQNGRMIKEGIYTAIVGKPNVGKSSFLNCILREDRAIVTDIPGTTRDTLEEEVRIGSTLLHLIDTAGIHDTEDKIESIGIDKAKESIKKADFVICMIDSSKKLETEDFFVLEESKKNKGVILLNKCDEKTVMTPEEFKNQCVESQSVQWTEEVMENKDIFLFSAKRGEGLENLEDYLQTQFIENKISYNDEVYITNIRQKEAMLDTAESLKQLLQSIEDGMPEDLYSIDLYNAYESLGKIIGETVEEDIIDKIFKDFCMGK